MKRVFAVLALGVALYGCAPETRVEKRTARFAVPAQSAVFNERNLAELMESHAKHVVSPQPWAGYWWPYTQSGIASAYHDPDRMSPADKYDLAIRNSTEETDDSLPSTAAWERLYHGPGLLDVAGWWGHCNGWAAAAIMVPEPRAPLELFGVKFDVRDQKALLVESWMEFSGDFLGNRVNEADDRLSHAFWDVVPAQFHLILSNIVSRQNRGIILDRHTGHEVWNQPLVAYAFDPITQDEDLGSHPDYPDVYRVNITARIWWANDHVEVDEVSPKFDLEAAHDRFHDKFYPGRLLRYELWLDGPLEFDENGKLVGSGDILITSSGGRYVGGVWKNGMDPAGLVHSHPDFMWVPFGQQHSTGYKNVRIDDNWIRRNIASPYRL